MKKTREISMRDNGTPIFNDIAAIVDLEYIVMLSIYSLHCCIGYFYLIE